MINKKTKPKTKTSPIIPVFLIIAVLAALSWVVYKNIKPGVFNRENQPSIESSLNSPKLPDGWKTVEENSGSTVLKIEKESGSGSKSVAVLTKSTAEIKDPKAYSISLMNGARSTIPSLRYLESNAETIGESYVQKMTGQYFNGGKKIWITQRLVININQVSTITLTHGTTKLSEDETQKVMDFLLAKI